MHTQHAKQYRTMVPLLEIVLRYLHGKRTKETKGKKKIPWPWYRFPFSHKSHQMLARYIIKTRILSQTYIKHRYYYHSLNRNRLVCARILQSWKKKNQIKSFGLVYHVAVLVASSAVLYIVIGQLVFIECTFWMAVPVPRLYGTISR